MLCTLPNTKASSGLGNPLMAAEKDKVHRSSHNVTIVELSLCKLCNFNEINDKFISLQNYYITIQEYKYTRTRYNIPITYIVCVQLPRE